MGRQRITEVIKQAAEKSGYSFYSGEQYRLETELGALPAIWLLPAQMTGKQGRYEVVCFYRVTMHLIMENPGCGGMEETFVRLEEDLAAIILVVLSDKDVRNITDTSYKSSDAVLTTRGELSLAVTFSIQLYF